MLDGHDRIALQFSGGRDSLAVLWLLRNDLHRLTVYHTNPGDRFPETLAAVEFAKALAPNFVEIATQRPAGTMVSDVVPVSFTPFGRAAEGTEGPIIIDRYSCCARTIMLPMQQRMVDDGITLVIRGQRNSERYKSPIRSGHAEGGVSYWFPIEDWSDDEVMSFLRDNDVPIPTFYETLSTGLDCMGCSAWWDEKRMSYLKQHHPETYVRVRDELWNIVDALSPSLQILQDELNQPETP
jgi:3'-phosphoadenosine 5'-phosphosulfate sulfotransferase (PAPS reductase)/FAD synthetase